MGKYFLRYSKKLIPTARKLRREMTIAERKLWRSLSLKQLDIRFRRQIPFGRYVLDFLCIELRIAIEVDGSQHQSEIGQRKDKKRETYLRKQGIRVLLFTNIDVLTNLDGVLQVINDYVQNGKNERNSNNISP